MKPVSLIRTFTLFSTQGGAPSQEDFVVGKKDRGLFVVADGFGGSGPGAVASQTACEAVLGFLEKEAGDLEATLPFVLKTYFSLAGNVLFNALVHASRKVSALNKNKSLNERGGASVLAGFLDEDVLALANVGTCSAWLVRGGRSTELVTPRSYSRLIDPVSVDPHPDRSAPLMAMGVSEDIEPEIFECRVCPGDWVILQTDGVTGDVRDALIGLQPEGEEAIEEFLRSREFDENASLALIRF